MDSSKFNAEYSNYTNSAYKKVLLSAEKENCIITLEESLRIKYMVNKVKKLKL
jgi:hypothetical protein